MEEIGEKADRRGGGKLFRFTLTERLFHWAYILPFTALLASGVLHKLHLQGREGWGGRTFLEGVHRGAALAFILAPLIVLLFGNRKCLKRSYRELTCWKGEDLKWLGLFFLGPLRGDHRLPPPGKFNAGQKLNALVTFFFALSLTLSGAWLMALKGTGALLPFLAHQLLVLFFLPFLLGHWFLALFNPSTRHALRGMILGEVEADWAREHHPRWYHEVAWEGHPGIHFGNRIGLRPRQLLDLLRESDILRPQGDGGSNDLLVLSLDDRLRGSERHRTEELQIKKAILAGGARILLEGSFPLVTAWRGKKLVGIGWAVTDMAFRTFICEVVVRKDETEAGLEEEVLHRLKGSLEGRGIPQFALPEPDQWEREEIGMSCRGYFEEFLPQTIGKSLVARIENLNLVLSFSIEGEGGGDWTLVLKGGKLMEIKEGREEGAEIVYRLDVPTFLGVVSGKLNSQKAFFSGRVKIGGNTLKALKMAVIFQGFFREYPFLSSQVSL